MSLLWSLAQTFGCQHALAFSTSSSHEVGQLLFEKSVKNINIYEMTNSNSLYVLLYSLGHFQTSLKIIHSHDHDNDTEIES